MTRATAVCHDVLDELDIVISNTYTFLYLAALRGVWDEPQTL